LSTRDLWLGRLAGSRSLLLSWATGRPGAAGSFGAPVLKAGMSRTTTDTAAICGDAGVSAVRNRPLPPAFPSS
jgi:hypothetical protein